MTPEQQNIAIAGYCGWSFSGSNFSHGWPSGKTNEDHAPKRTPDYCNDLNAMHAAEKILNNNDTKHYKIMLSSHLDSDWGLASASTRAEAFLRTLGKWTGE